ncbi:methyltransferase domain-containing protein [Undibacterium sp. RuRC25W]|uniref:methyltransferase domain-containing protein n=1 Tax=Undibacterium sp. RuRC25W TaxID=3413047 RepID=UPI003BF3A950
MAEFILRDPTQANFWDERFEKKFMPWDKGGVPQKFSDFVQAQHHVLHCLIPGCGNGYEVASLAQAGWHVTAIDFSPAAVQHAQQTLGPWAKHVVQADFFSYEPTCPLDVIYERAFFCALPPELRQSIIDRWAYLLPTNALLAGYFFFDDSENASKKGPPFSIHSQLWREMMSVHFEQIEDSPVLDSIPVFSGKERWQVWRRC